MKKPGFANILVIKYRGYASKLRLRYFKFLGLKVGQGSFVGKISFNWVNNVTIGKDSKVLDGVILGIGSGFNEHNTITIGDRAYIGHNVHINCTNKVTIGHDVMIAAGSKLLDVGHNYELGMPMNIQPVVSKSITLEDDVWLAANVVVLPGITIGKGSIVAAGSVVTKSIPPYEIWGGVPAKFIKNRS